ncbi:MAG: hypothetical protein K2M06_03010 [Muribaculaceae bacterium]|nr:hypothetical protein [Muribaculaceae bacterium]
MKIEHRIRVYAACALSLLLAAAVSSCSASCDKAQCADSDDTDDTRVAFTTVSESETYTLPGTDSLFNSDKDAVFSAHASLIMPANVSNANVTILREAIVKAATAGKVDVKSPEQTLKEYFKATAQSLGYPEVAKSDDDVDIMDADGFISITGTIASMSPRILSYAITEYLYPVHAANGQTTLTYVNYDFSDGKVMTLGDVFTPEGLKELPAVIAERAKETQPEAEITALPASGSYYIDYEGRIVFVYEQGEVAARAAGAVSAAFYPQELMQYMTPAGREFLK